MQTCNQAICHSGTTTNSRDVTLDLLDVASGSRLAQYEPGTTYALRFTIASPEAGRLRWGFEMTSLAGTTMAGVFTAGPTTATQPGGGRQYVSHAINQVGDNVPLGFQWEFSWQAPATDVGDVTFYACGNAANRSFSSSGDYIECTTFVVTSLPPADADGDTVPDAADNCPNDSNGSQADFDGDRVGDACDDSDEDGATDELEIAQGTLPLDADTDDDGLSDTDETDVTLTSPTNPDTDGDGVQDGTELGETTGVPDPPGPGVGTDMALFVPDADAGATTTDPLDEDTDLDTCLDGDEDLDGDGAVGGPPETDPNDSLDCPVVADTLIRMWRTNRDPPPLAGAACATTPCTGTTTDLAICREAVNFEEYAGATLPFQVPLTGPGGFPGVLVFVEYDSDTTSPDTLDLIDVTKDPSVPGGILVTAH